MGDGLDPRAALAAIWDVVGRANRYAQETSPRREANRGQRDAALYTLVESVRVIGEALRPFLPTTASRILSHLNLSPEPGWLPALAWGQLRPGTLVEPPTPLFPHLTE